MRLPRRPLREPCGGSLPDDPAPGIAVPGSACRTRDSAGAAAPLSAATGGFRGGPPGLRARRARPVLRLVQGEGDPGGILEDREPSEPRDLRPRHDDRATRGANLAERLVDILRQDVVEDAGGQVLGLLE